MFRSKKRTHIVNVKEESIVDVLWGFGIGNPVKFVCKKDINQSRENKNSISNESRQFFAELSPTFDDFDWLSVWT